MDTKGFISGSIKASIPNQTYVEDLSQAAGWMGNYECRLDLWHKSLETHQGNHTRMFVLTTDKPTTEHLLERMRALMACYDGVVGEHTIQLTSADIQILPLGDARLNSLVEAGEVTMGKDNVKIVYVSPQAFAIAA